ncbi:MAG: helix-turn-helix transcriptional regulator [Clostridia bacterium]|nr:helix-turn-helix transcriptional regulator [Clostridia bacterium]
MPKTEYNATYFKVTHTIEENPPHPTIPYNYYDDTYGITILIRGEGTCSVEGNVYEIKDGDLMVLSPDEIRSFKFSNHGYHERLSVYFSDSVLLPLFEYDLPLMNVFRNRYLGLGNKYAFDEHETEQAMFILNQLKELVQKENNPINTARLHTLIFQLLFWIYDSRDLKKSHEMSTVNDSVIFDICCYIKNNLDKDLSYNTLQKTFLVSRYQLTEVFVRNMGMSLTEYIIRKRLNRAVFLIREGTGIEEAAYNAGFHTYSHFYKEFVKYYKKSPRAFFDNMNTK